MRFDSIRRIEAYPADAMGSLLVDEDLLRRGLPFYSTRINDPCVSVGFNQDVEAEVDTELAEQLGIPIVRRRTGGGAVYRDRGCVAYSFMLPMERRDIAQKTVIAALAAMGVEVEPTGRNDLFWNGRKVSGCAWLQSDENVLLHGSLLFSTDLDLMARLLDRGKTKYRGTAIASVKSRVANLSRAFPGMDAERFRAALMENLEAQLEVQGYRTIACGL